MRKNLLRLLTVILLTLLISDSVLGQTYTIHTVAGGGLPENISGASANLSDISGFTVDASGNLFMTAYHTLETYYTNIIIDYNVVLRMEGGSGLLTRVAGAGAAGYGGDNGPATGALLNLPQGVAVDATGAIYVADTANARVRKISDGVIETVAGNGTPGFSGDYGPAVNAQLNFPTSVAVDQAGNLYIADSLNWRVRKVSHGVIATVAGNGTEGSDPGPGPATSAQFGHITGLTVSAAGDLYIADEGSYRVYKVSNGMIATAAGNGTPGFSGDNGPAASAQLDHVSGLAVDGEGNLYIADASNVRIRKVSNGVITTVAGSGVKGFTGDNGPAVSARLQWPRGVAVDGAGNLYIWDEYRIRKVSNGMISTIAGGGVYEGPATNAQLQGPGGVCLDASGALYMADTANHRVRKVSNGVITTVAGNGTSGLSGDDGPAAAAQLYWPSGVAVDALGNLYIADKGNHRIRIVSNGVITTVAGNGTPGFSGDNGPAVAAQLNWPTGVAVDPLGNLYIADGGNNGVRKVSNGVITTVEGNGASGVAVDAAGNLYIVGGERVREVSNGVSRTVAGIGEKGFSGDNGPAVEAKLFFPSGVAVEGAGSLFVADTFNNRIRKIAGGVIATIAGIGTPGFGGDDGPGTSAILAYPGGVAVDNFGNVYLADTGNRRIRVLTPSGPSCSYSVNTLGSIVGATGGAVSVDILTGTSCPWAVSGLPGWIAISGNKVGAGPATVMLSVAANAAGPRLATVAVAGIPVGITQDANLPPSGPAITAVTNAATGNLQAIQSNSWVTVWGSNLAPPGSSRAWQAEDIVDGQLPASLDGVSVTINGKPAFVAYISPAQLNVLAPDDDAAGTVDVVVTNQGVSSAPFPVRLQTHAPAFFVFGPPNQNYVAAVFPYKPDGSFDTYAAPPGAFGDGVPSRPAKPGELVELYGTGFGPTQPKPPAGKVFFGPFPAETPVTVTIGGIPADVQWAGLSAAGVYQLNVVVPESLPGGDAKIVATAGGVQTREACFIPVQP